MTNNIAKQPVMIADGVTVVIADSKVVVNGPQGTLEANIPHGVALSVRDGHVVVEKVSEATDLGKFAGLIRALVANMMTGVTKGFEKKLELTGVGYRAKLEGQELVLNVGYALPVRLKPKTGTAISVLENIITVSGADKQLVGDVASDIRRIRPPDPYKGKGIKYLGEKLRRKVGKAAKAIGAVSK